jgi:hypothetical protein
MVIKGDYYPLIGLIPRPRARTHATAPDQRFMSGPFAVTAMQGDRIRPGRSSESVEMIGFRVAWIASKPPK